MADTNTRYLCPYCKKNVLFSGYYRHQQTHHFDLLWTDENIKHLHIALRQAKKGLIDIITVPELKNQGTGFYLNPFNNTIYKNSAKASNAFKSTPNLKDKTNDYIAYCENILKRLNKLDDIPDDYSDMKKVFQDLIYNNDYNNEQIKKYELLLAKLKEKVNIDEAIYEECDMEAELEARMIDKEELLSPIQINKYAKLIKTIPLTRQQAFAKPAPPAPEPEKKSDMITVEKKEEIVETPTVIEQPSIPPLASVSVKPIIKRKEVAKRDYKPTVQLPPEEPEPIHEQTEKESVGEFDHLSATELMKLALADLEQKQKLKQQTVNAESIKQSLLLPPAPEQPDRPPLIANTKIRIPKKTIPLRLPGLK